MKDSQLNTVTAAPGPRYPQANSIHATQRRTSAAVGVPMPSIHFRRLTDGSEVYDAFVRIGSQKTYLRRYQTREEAAAAVMEFIRTGEKPPAKGSRHSVVTERRATIKKERRNLDGSNRFDVMGRLGRGKEARYIAVGTFSTRAEAEQKAAIFDATGQIFAMPAGPKPRRSGGPRTNPVPRPAERKTREFTPVPTRTLDQAARIEALKASLRRVS